MQTTSNLNAYISIFYSARLRNLLDSSGFKYCAELGIFEKTGLIPEVDPSDLYSINIYSDIGKSQLLDRLDFKDNSVYVQAVKNEILYSKYNERIPPTTECKLEIPLKLLSYNIKGFRNFSKNYYKKLNTKNLVCAHLGNTLFKYRLSKPIVTSDGLKYYSCLNYFQAMHTTDYNVRKAISFSDSSDETFFKKIKKDSLRSDFSNRMALKILYKAFNYAIQADSGFRYLLLLNPYTPLVFFTDMDDFLYNYGISSQTYCGLNFVGKALMYARYEYTHKENFDKLLV